MNKVYCVYHNADFDGMASAAIINHYCENVDEFIGMDYGMEFPLWDKLDKNDTVYMVDFGLQPFEDMVLLNQICDLIWIDHHKTAIDNIEDSTIEFKGIQEIGIGACQMVWEYLFPDKSIPYGIKLLAEYDVWNHSNPNTLPFQYGLRIETDTSPISKIWNDIFINKESFIDRIVETGKIIITYENLQNKILCKVYSFETNINELKAIAINKGLTSSMIFDSIWDKDKYDCMLVFSRIYKHWTCSLYTDKEGIDVSKTAKKYGGGGHKNAAGFQCLELPFEY